MPGQPRNRPIMAHPRRAAACAQTPVPDFSKGMFVTSQPHFSNNPAAQPVDVVIMAAGKGTRMRSKTPKVLQRLAGRPLLQHVVDTAADLRARSVVVITGHGAIEVEAASAGFTGASATFDLNFVRQEPQLGTGHAVQQAVPVLPDDGVVVVLSGDVPLTQADTLFHLIQACGGDKLALLTLEQSNPAGYGRIVRNADGAVQAIVEHKDATDAQRAITEIYSGIMAVPAARLKAWLARFLDTKTTFDNYPVQLAELERAYPLQQAHRLMEEGVRLADPARIDVRGDLLCAHDVSIDVNCVFSGQVSLGEGVSIGANCVIANCVIEAGAVIHPFTHIDGEKQGVTVGAGALIGPFARLRPGAKLGAEVHIGNFVEVKNSTLAAGAKANHLAYLGDATVGERVNYGAGSITANYDGANKHRTVIEADVHVGSNCVLVAPVTIGAGGTVGGGSTITKSTEPGALSVARGKQVSIANWARPAKKSKA